MTPLTHIIKKTQAYPLDVIVNCTPKIVGCRRTPSSYTYQWKRDGVNIGSATSSTYALVAADIGAAVTCEVTAINAYGSAAQISNATGAIAAGDPVNTVPPAVTGNEGVGQTLSTTNGTWTLV